MIRHNEDIKQRSNSTNKRIDNDNLYKALSFENKSNEVFFKPHKEHLLRFISDEQKESAKIKALQRYEDQITKERQQINDFEVSIKTQVEQHNMKLADEKQKKFLRSEEMK